MLLLLLLLYVIDGGRGRVTGRHVDASFTGETRHQRRTCQLALNYLRSMSDDDDDDDDDDDFSGTSREATRRCGGVNTVLKQRLMMHLVSSSSISETFHIQRFNIIVRQHSTTLDNL